ncbi:MAG: CcoQ/FixQ family Cbb3-type cytochrome c oxidase assembly chaperone [Alphaproteobacteria bacterium]|nr:CcoQ/FixQ family Cbb3-type cytochrome c oxidase assembly chaperone [Alphaproteobacteria bacterium]
MEGLTYEQVAGFAHSWGMVYFVVMFLAVLAYALWPSNKARFDRAASIPLHDDESV